MLLGMGPVAWIVTIFAVVIGFASVFGISGIFKFLVADKTPYIILGIFVLLILLRRRSK